ncbi:MAG: nucleotidyltransferase family protein [Candidatus Omnitrophica bacterium]|nr:nucleotidyltransferase family protein [Candidatus Omnitrophota bacterium]
MGRQAAKVSSADLERLCVEPDRLLKEAVLSMDRSRLGIVLVVDGQRRLVGTITDGDIRRAMLARIGLDQPLRLLLDRKADTPYARPITAPVGADPSLYLALLKAHGVLHLPLVDEESRVVGLVTMDEFLPEEPLSLHAVVMAGGKGSRLHPLTENLPKPMLPIGDRPLLEIIIRQLSEAGIRHVKVATHHKPEKIEAYFQDGSRFGVELTYVEEDQPLGTGGGLSLMGRPDQPTLVINGDILTEVDFRAMLAFHKEHRADLTVAVRHYDIQVPYGVVECEGAAVRGISEKPVMGFFVNAGIYLLDPIVYQHIPSGQRFDMTDLIQRLIAEGCSVVSFPIREYWLDIGEHAEYERAQQDVSEGKVKV